VLGALGGAFVKLLPASGEPVALALELLEGEQAGAGSGQAAGVGADVRKAVGDDRGALALELGHLSAQRAAGGALAGLDGRRGRDEGGAPKNRCLLGLAHYPLLLTARSPGFYQRPARRSRGERRSATVRAPGGPASKRRAAAPQRLLDVQLGHTGHLRGEQREPACARTRSVARGQLAE